ncbi:MAG TPA: SMI1/KNR4 family protein [Longimicrobiaceae bacterium]|nr:SMI1/KNR4 family protein [Longimicrobiaceae bacterium]
MQTLANGTKLVGHVPHVAPEAWLHVVFPALSEPELVSLKTSLGGPLPEDYRNFLRQMNGIRLFSGALTIDGLRKSYERTGEAVWQPFDVVDLNTLERPQGAKPTDFFIGGYDWDGSVLCVDTGSGETWRRDRDGFPSLNRWPSLFHMLADETERLAGHFDAEGKEINPSIPTTPPSDA